MNVGVAHSEQNPNTSWLNSKGIWFTYIIFTTTMHLILLSLPFLTTPVAWTLTNVFHNLVNILKLFKLENNVIYIRFVDCVLFASYCERSTVGNIRSR